MNALRCLIKLPVVLLAAVWILALTVCSCSGSKKDDEAYANWIEVLNSDLDRMDTASAQVALDNARPYVHDDLHRNVLYAYDILIDENEFQQIPDFVAAAVSGDFSEMTGGRMRYCDYALVSRLFERYAFWFASRGDRAMADVYLTKAAEVAKEGGVLLSYFRIERRISRRNEEVGNYNAAISGYQELLAFCYKYNLKEEATDILFRLSMAFLRLGDISTAQIYVDEMEAMPSFSISEDCKYWMVMASLSARGADTVMFARSVEELRSLAESDSSVPSSFMSSIEILEANYFLIIGSVDSARVAINGARSHLAHPSIYFPSKAYIEIYDARICISENRLEDARKILDAIDVASLRSTDLEIYEFYLAVSARYYEAIGDIKQAYIYAKQNAQLVDSLRAEVKGNNLAFATLENRRDTAVVTQVNKIAQIENEVEKVAIAQYLWVSLAVVTVVSAILVFYLVSYRRIKTRANEIERQRATLASEVNRRKELLLAQQKQLEAKNSSLQSELIFARHVQTNIFSNEDILTSPGVAEHFVFFRPCYQVSGDFYWFFDSGDKLFVCAADATGHGIPGAFISMVASTLLADIASNPDNRSASKLLECLSASLSGVLRNNSDIVNSDSVDMSMLCIDRVSHKITVSMARHVAYIVHYDGTSELVQGTKRCVGEIIEVEDGRPFTDVELNVSAGDCVYLASDGYVSQFGGPQNQKFKRKRFEDLLAETHDLPADQQKMKLERKFDNWRGKCDQTDDVLVVGIRIGDFEAS